MGLMDVLNCKLEHKCKRNTDTKKCKNFVWNLHLKFQTMLIFSYHGVECTLSFEIIKKILDIKFATVTIILYSNLDVTLISNN